MAQRIAVCFENLKAGPGAPSYLACVALEHGQPGLGLDESGVVVWRDAARTALELFALRDGRLALAVLTESETVQIERAGRVFTIPQAMKGIAGEVVVLDGDLLLFGVNRFRIHVQGPVSQEHPPLPVESPRSSVARRSAAPSDLPVGPLPPIALPQVEEKELERARHLARKLLSELARSRAEVVAEGRMRKDLLRRLGPEVEEARRRWKEGLPKTVGDLYQRIFDQAVVELLAGGKKENLGQ